MDMSRLRWRCRRGMAELDIMLDNFLTYGYLQLDQHKKTVFYKMLEYPDNELHDYLILKTQPRDREIQDVIISIRAAFKN